MALGTGVSGWPCVEVSGSMYYQVTLGAGVIGSLMGVSRWPCDKVSDSMYY